MMETKVSLEIRSASKRETKREAKRSGLNEGVIRIAAELFFKHGYDAVTIEDIVTAAGVSRRSFFRHFRQKDEILVRWMGRFNTQLCTALAAQPAALKPLAAFRAALDQVDEISTDGARQLYILQMITQRSAAARAALLNVHRSWEDGIVNALLAWNEDGRADDFRMVAGAGLLAMRLAVEAWSVLPREAADSLRLRLQLDESFRRLSSVS